MNIASRDYDFLGMAGEIEAYCNRNQIAPKLKNRIQLVFEETIQLLVPVLENPRVQAVCEYSEATETAEWTIRYAGPRYDITGTNDDLALAVLKGMTESMDYAWKESEPMANSLYIKIK